MRDGTGVTSGAPIFVGIDVACRTGKRLPLCVVERGHRLWPLDVQRAVGAAIPRGLGNREILAPAPFRDAALGVRAALERLAAEIGRPIEGIAIDAPAAAPTSRSRLCEDDLGRSGLSSFRTPPASAWAAIREACERHLQAAGRAGSLPYANKIWMLYGFELFAALRRGVADEVIEVYPYAIVRALLPSCAHKTTEEGYRDQLAVLARHTGWKPGALESRLKATVPGTRHDRLDAFMSAWVASLGADRRRAFGDASQPDDAIWVPRE